MDEASAPETGIFTNIDIKLQHALEHPMAPMLGALTDHQVETEHRFRAL